MDIAYKIAQYLDAANFGTLGTDIFVEQMPPEINCVAVMRASGSLNSYLPMENVLLDIYVKNTSASTAITTLENIKKHIHRMYDTQQGDALIYSMLADDIQPVLRDDEYAKIYKLSVQVMFRNNNLIS